MEFLNDKIIMTLDTEYQTNPKRLLSLAYIITKDNKIVKKEVFYIKHNLKYFKVDESSESFQFHKLTNNFLQKNGKSINDILNYLLKDLNNVNILVGQNILSADLSLIRKECFGVGLLDSFNEIIKKVVIYDTMNIFKSNNIGQSGALANIYNFLFMKNIENHHEALSDCKHTLKCFYEMLKLKYKVSKEIYLTNYDILESYKNTTRNCQICNIKLIKDIQCYKFTDDIFSNNLNTFKLSVNLEKDNFVCKKCMNLFEVIVFNEDSSLNNIIKLNQNIQLIDKFFTFDGNKKRKIVYLKSKYKDKDEIKKLGGRWDRNKKSWYFICKDNDKDKIKLFSKWIPKNEINL